MVVTANSSVELVSYPVVVAATAITAAGAAAALPPPPPPARATTAATTTAITTTIQTTAAPRGLTGWASVWTRISKHACLLCPPHWCLRPHTAHIPRSRTWKHLSLASFLVVEGEERMVEEAPAPTHSTTLVTLVESRLRSTLYPARPPNCTSPAAV